MAALPFVAARLLSILVRGARRSPCACGRCRRGRGCCGGGCLFSPGQLPVAGRCDGLPAGGACRNPGFTAPCVLRPSAVPRPVPAGPGRFQPRGGAAGDHWRGSGCLCQGGETARHLLAGLCGTLCAGRRTGKRAPVAGRLLVQGHAKDRPLYRDDRQPPGGPGHRRAGEGSQACGVDAAALGSHRRQVACSRDPRRPVRRRNGLRNLLGIRAATGRRNGWRWQHRTTWYRAIPEPASSPEANRPSSSAPARCFRPMQW